MIFCTVLAFRTLKWNIFPSQKGGKDAVVFHFNVFSLVLSISTKLFCFGFFQEESLKWSDHGRVLFQRNEFLLAERCANFALYFRTSPGTRVQACLCKAFAQYEMGKVIGARTEINEIKRLDPNLAKVW